MKRIPQLLAIIILAGCASMQTVSPEKLIYQKIIEAPGMTQAQLYDKALQWMAYTFRSSKNVIQYQNQNEFKIIGKGYLDVNYSGLAAVPTYFTLTIETKDGRLRITFSNMGFDNGMPFNNQLQLDAFSMRAYDLVYSLQKSLESPAESW
ncbi:MAG: DUF4468 domain-containing protein [Spirochaetota bacterium]|jgi:hypothetical protein